METQTLATDIRTWLDCRMQTLSKITRIPWEALADQFGSEYEKTPEGLHRFRLTFLSAFKRVSGSVKWDYSIDGLTLYPN